MPLRFRTQKPFGPRCAGEDVRERVRRLPGGPSMPLTIHLRQEIDRLNRVLGAAGATLRTLRLAIAGTVAMSDDLAEALEALHSARVPRKWLKFR